MERKIYKELLNWKNTDMQKPLMIIGARQIGKTYIIKEFCEKEFKKNIYINLLEHSEIIKIFNTFFTSIPTLIFSYIVLNFDYFKGFEMDKAIIAYTIVLTLLGWSKLAGIIEDNVRRVMREDFIEGEFAIGKNKLQIAFQNIIPHIIPSGISLFLKKWQWSCF